MNPNVLHKGPLVGDGEFIEAARAPAMIKPWGKVGVQHAKDLKWKTSADVLEGAEVAVVGEDADSGRSAMFVRIPPNTKFDDEPRSQASGSHAVILKGSVSFSVGDHSFVLEAGDYLRAPAKWVHSISGSDAGALMFMISDGKYAVNRIGRSALASVKHIKPGIELDAVAPAHFRRKELRFQRAPEHLGDIEVATVFMDKRRGAHGLIAKIPAGKSFDEHKHIHTSATHQVVLNGSVTARLESGEIVLNEGDYFRGAENMVCNGSHVPEIRGGAGCDIFILSETKFGTVFLV